MVDNKQIQKLNKVLQKQIVQRFGVMAMALLVVGSVSYFGTSLNQGSKAATGGTLAIAPATATRTTGSTFTVAIRENSGTNPVNAVQASMTYNASQLQFVSVTEGTAFPTVAATSTSTPGLIRIGRGTAPGTTTTGDQIVASVTFRVLATSGTTSLAFDAAFSNIAFAADGTNMLSTTIGASYVIQSNGSLTMTPATGSYTSGATIPVVVTENSGTELVNAVQAAITYDASRLQFVSITEGATFTTVAATDTGTAGIVRLARGAPTAVSGSRAVATVNFRVIGAAGSTSLSYNSAQSFIARSSDNTNVLATAAGATYTVTQLAPTISAVTPASGTSAGGTTVTITGTNFVSGAVVRFDTAAATNVVFNSATSITARAPAHAAGAASVVVTNPDGTTVTRAAGFNYVAGPPAITGMTPLSSTVTGGTTVTLTGTGFVAGAQVLVDGIAATNIVVASGTSLTARVPAHAAGTVILTVTNPDGQSGQFSGFRYISSAGDVTNDGRVNAIDISLLISHDGENYPPADFNGDGTVGAADLAIMLSNWTW